MPIGYQPPSNPFLSRLGMEQPNPQSAASDILGMAAPVGMAAAEPEKFLAQKLASYLKRLEGIRTEHTALQKAAMQQEGIRGGILPSPQGGLASLEKFIRGFMEPGSETLYLERLLGSIDEQALVQMNRAKKALDLWRLRNLPVGETVRRSTGAKNLYEWYKQALQRGPYSGDLP